MSMWLLFVLSATLVVLSATKLAEYGDVISVRTGLGGVFVGALLMAGATSLPELLTTVNALRQEVPDLAAGNVFGSNMLNMFLLAVLDAVHQQARILRRVAMKHALAGGMACLLVALAVFFVLADIDWRIGWVGVDSLAIIAAYIIGVRLLQGGNDPALALEPRAPVGEFEAALPSLRRAAIGFSAATVALLVTTPWLVASSVYIAEVTGLGTGFIGTALVALVTSLPELVAIIAAARLGAYDLAVGNLFGSNMFNMFILGLTDIFYLEGRYLSAIDPLFAVAGLIGLVMTLVALVGNVARIERKLWIIEVDALLLVLVYWGGLWLLYTRGVAF